MSETICTRCGADLRLTPSRLRARPVDEIDRRGRLSVATPDLNTIIIGKRVSGWWPRVHAECKANCIAVSRHWKWICHFRRSIVTQNLIPQFQFSSFLPSFLRTNSNHFANFFACCWMIFGKLVSFKDEKSFVGNCWLSSRWILISPFSRTKHSKHSATCNFLILNDFCLNLFRSKMRQVLLERWYPIFFLLN